MEVVARIHNGRVVIGRPTDRGAVLLDEVTMHRFAAVVNMFNDQLQQQGVFVISKSRSAIFTYTLLGKSTVTRVTSKVNAAITITGQYAKQHLQQNTAKHNQTLARTEAEL